MKYNVCFQNCIEDYFSENASSIVFDTFDAAIRYLVSIDENSDVMAPDVEGEVRWFFGRCSITGEIPDPDPERDVVELYQIINIIPDESGETWCTEPYTDDPEAIVSMSRSYTLDCLGKVHNVHVGEIVYLDHEED